VLLVDVFFVLEQGLWVIVLGIERLKRCLLFGERIDNAGLVEEVGKAALGVEIDH
jgi:hypothetical protein